MTDQPSAHEYLPSLLTGACRLCGRPESNHVILQPSAREVLELAATLRSSADQDRFQELRMVTRRAATRLDRLAAQSASAPERTGEVVALAEDIITHGDNIAYPSRSSSQYVRKVMRSLVEAFRDMETRALHAETVLAEQDIARENQDPPAKWLDAALRELARELLADPKTPWIGERDPKQHVCWIAADRLAATPAPTFTDEILQADALPPEATFNNAPDMLKWLNEAPAFTDKQEALGDLKSHREVWRGAILSQRVVTIGPDDDGSYWDHELRAFDRTFTSLLATPAAQPQVIQKSASPLAATHNSGEGLPSSDAADGEADTSQATYDLLPCPFCGGQPTAVVKDRAIIGCRNDDCFGPRTTADFLVDAIAQWNTRAAPQADGVRAALEPFAKLADEYDRAHEWRVKHYGDEGRRAGPPHSDSHIVPVSIGDLRRARAALAAAPPARSEEPQTGVKEVVRLLNKIADLAYDADVGEPLDDAIGYANKALAALQPAPIDRDWIGLVASEKAAYNWPDDTDLHKQCRAAYVAGAVDYARPLPPSSEGTARPAYADPNFKYDERTGSYHRIPPVEES